MTSRSNIIGKKLEVVEKELNDRYGKKWFTMHEGLPGHIDRDPERINVWVDDQGFVTRISRG